MVVAVGVMDPLSTVEEYQGDEWVQTRSGVQVRVHKLCSSSSSSAQSRREHLLRLLAAAAAAAASEAGEARLFGFSALPLFQHCSAALGMQGLRSAISTGLGCCWWCCWPMYGSSLWAARTPS